MVKKFVLVTRGRTGSTAVLDELGKARALVATQELFTRSALTDKKLKDYYQLLPPLLFLEAAGGCVDANASRLLQRITTGA
jgi:hypothetical protein